MALIAVLWMVAALTLIVTGMVHSVRGEVRMASSQRDAVTAGARGEAAIALVLQRLGSGPESQGRLQRLEVVFDGAPIQVEVMPLSGLIDINGVQAPLLTRVLMVAGGLDEGAASALAQSVVALRDDASGPTGGTGFEAVEDLMRVPGFGYDVYAAIAPLLTAEGQAGGRVNPMAAPLPVLSVLAEGQTGVALAVAQARDRGDASVNTTGLNPEFIDSGGVPRYQLTAREAVPDGGHLLTIRRVDARPDLREGLPWRVFYSEQGFEPAASAPD